jgi:hypothetical protein
VSQNALRVFQLIHQVFETNDLSCSSILIKITSSSSMDPPQITYRIKSYSKPGLGLSISQAAYLFFALERL